MGSIWERCCAGKIEKGYINDNYNAGGEMEPRTLTEEEYQERMKMIDAIMKKYVESSNIFMANKSNEDVGVNLPKDTLNYWNKCGKKLISDKKLKERLSQIRSIHYRNVLCEPLNKYELSEWLVCLEEGIFIVEAVYMLSKVVGVLPDAVDYKGILLITHIVFAYKKYEFPQKAEWYDYFKGIVEQILQQECLDKMNPKEVELLREF